MVEGFLMPEVMVCEYCFGETMLSGDPYVVIQRPFEEKPERWAHPDCHRKELKDIEGDRERRGGRLGIRGGVERGDS